MLVELKPKSLSMLIGIIASILAIITASGYFYSLQWIWYLVYGVIMAVVVTVVLAMVSRNSVNIFLPGYTSLLGLIAVRLFATLWLDHGPFNALEWLLLYVLPDPWLAATVFVCVCLFAMMAYAIWKENKKHQ